MEGRVMGATILVLCSIFLPLISANHLSLDFYDLTCPQAEQIVHEVVANAYERNPGIAAGLIRILFHDCFVHGCDASLLLDSTPSGEPVEKKSAANGENMRGLEVLDEAKARLEQECPDIVSCADTIIFAARDSAVLSGVPGYRTPGGRRDGLVSRRDDVDLPGANLSIDELVESFTRKGMTRDDLVVLNGAHSIGEAHCPFFAYRAMGYNETSLVDPKLAQEEIETIKLTCKQEEDWPKTVMPLDSKTKNLMDNGFYKELLVGKGVLESDSTMVSDPRTRRIVNKMANDERRWLRAFSNAMFRLGEVEVKTGTEGEIRKECRRVNPAIKRHGGGFGFFGFGSFFNNIAKHSKN